MTTPTPTCPTPLPRSSAAGPRANRAAHRRPHARRGVTLIELLVAVALTVIILTAVNVIFNSAQRLVAVGTGVSEVTINARAIGDQLERDAAMMVGPADVEGGFLAIVYNIVAAPDDMDDIQGPFSVVGAQNQLNGRYVRDDQLFFIRHRGDLESMTPANVTSFAANDNLSASHVRVWYGHAVRVSSTGEVVERDPITGAVLYPINDLGLGDNSAAPETPVPGTNEMASQWVMGRQALFLEPDPAPGTVFIQTTNPFNTPLSAGPSWFVSGTGTDPAWYRSYSDVIDLGVREVMGPGTTTNELPVLQPGHTDAEYNLRALRLGFAHESTRPHVVTNPMVAAAGDSQYAFQLNSGIIAQQHPMMAVGVSDFAVEFAADLNYDGRVDVDDASTPAPNTGQIKWYGFWHNDPEGTGGRRDPAAPDGAELPFDITQPIVYRIPEGAAAPAGFLDQYVNGAGANRKPGRNYNGQGYGIAAETSPLYAQAAFVWRHDDHEPYDSRANNPSTGIDEDSSSWPYMIRVRYRVHDNRNHVGDAGVAGRWFEQIIRVPRP